MQHNLKFMLRRLQKLKKSNKQINLTELNADYSIYIPSMQPMSARSVRLKSTDWQKDSLPYNLEPKDFDYLRNDNRFWTYKYALASAENFKDKRNNAVSTKDTHAFILGDSGGFQIGKGTFGEAANWRGMDEKSVSEAWRRSRMREEIIQWCETNCSYAMTIDIPLWVKRKNETNSPFNSCSVKRLTELSVENLKYLSDVRGRWSAGEHICKYLNVLQGDKESDENNWYKAVKGFKLDGWALAGGVGVVGGPYRILKRMLIMADEGLLDKGYDWLHILMLGRLLWSPFVTSIQKAVRKHNPKFTISYDSSSAYKVGGQFEHYYWTRELTKDLNTWSHAPLKLPSTYGYANSKIPIKLAHTKCIGKGKCNKCASDGVHLEAPLDSPIAKLLTMQDILINKDKKAKRRGGKLFDEVLTNHNVFIIVDSMIRANNAVFLHNNAPEDLMNACGLVGDLFQKNENWDELLTKNRHLFEKSLDFTPKQDVLG